MASVYKKHTHREHILELPDTYIGSVETIDDTRWVFNNESHKMEFKNICFNPGLYKIFDEVLVNARDAMVRSGNVKHIDVTCGMVKDIYRDEPNERYEKILEGIKNEFSFISFIITEHKNKFSEGWNNDKLLVLVKK